MFFKYNVKPYFRHHCSSLSRGKQLRRVYLKADLMQSFALNIQENVPLAPLTTLGVGGPARFFVEAATAESVAEAVEFARSRQLPLFVLGGGSNLLVSDHGWNGMVLKPAIRGVERQENEGKILFDVGAGEDWDAFVAQTIEHGCGGVECLSGIPGSVGGTPVQNVGAYGQEVSETIVSIRVFDIAESRVREMAAAECEFAYRTSIFNSSQRGRHIVLRVTYALIPDGNPSLRYADLQKRFAGRGATPTLVEVRDAVRAIRQSKGMLIKAGDPDSCSAGSFFKNPVLSASAYQDLVRRAAQRNLRVPSYPALSQQNKISAAWLVENSGFKKGYAKGRSAISSKHALALVNRGGALASELVALNEEIQSRVMQDWGIHLDPEPIFVGF